MNADRRGDELFNFILLIGVEVVIFKYNRHRHFLQNLVSGEIRKSIRARVLARFTGCFVIIYILVLVLKLSVFNMLIPEHPSNIKKLPDSCVNNIYIYMLEALILLLTLLKNISES